MSFVSHVFFISKILYHFWNTESPMWMRVHHIWNIKISVKSPNVNHHLLDMNIWFTKKIISVQPIPFQSNKLDITFSVPLHFIFHFTFRVLAIPPITGLKNVETIYFCSWFNRQIQVPTQPQRNGGKCLTYKTMIIFY